MLRLAHAALAAAALVALSAQAPAPTATPAPIGSPSPVKAADGVELMFRTDTPEANGQHHCVYLSESQRIMVGVPLQFDWVCVKH